MVDTITLGCIGTGDQDTDYILCNGDVDLLPKLVKQDELRFEYNQANQSRSKVSCTIFAAVGMASDLMNYEFSLKEIKEIDEMSYERGRTRGKGWYVQSAVKLVADWWNANEELVKKYGKLAYYRISKYDDDIIEEAIGKLYTLDGNFCPTAEYILDYTADGMLDGKNFGVNTNGHSVDIICKEGQRGVKDSYKGKQYNFYGLKNKLSAITNFGPYVYIYTKVKEDNLEDLKRLNEFKTTLLNAIELNSKIWNLTNDTAYQNKLHEMNELNRKKIKDIDEQLKRYM